MKKIIVLFLLLVFMLCGCNQQHSNKNQSSNNQQSEINNSSVTNENPSSENQQVTDSKVVGVISLGSYDDYNQYIERIKSSKHLSEYAFLSELSKDKFISASEGSETFAIIPAKNVVSVYVYKLIYDDNLNKTQNGDLLYSSSNADPIVVKCNFSDIFPDVNIKITDKDGTITEFSPCTSMKDGKLEVVSKSKDFIEDLTIYQ